MGQRHQFYVKLPQKVIQKSHYLYFSEEDIKHDILAFHHQCHYGTKPLESAKRLLEFYQTFKRSKEFIIPPFEPSFLRQEIANNIEKILQVNWVDGCIEDFTLEGYEIALDPSIIDNDDGITIIDLSQEKPKIAFMFSYDEPLTAEEYVRCYHNHERYLDWKEEWITEQEQKIDELLCFFQQIQLLTLDEIKTMFPKLYEIEQI